MDVVHEHVDEICYKKKKGYIYIYIYIYIDEEGSSPSRHPIYMYTSSQSWLL
jgi:hypothetical protein